MKQKRYWLRFGFGFLGFVFILFWILFFFGPKDDVWGISNAFILSNVPGGLVYGLFNVHLPDTKEIPIIISLSIIIYFIIGAIIGWIYGKIKNRNKVLKVVQ